jgi:hypothetical protein
MPRQRKVSPSAWASLTRLAAYWRSDPSKNTESEEDSIDFILPSVRCVVVILLTDQVHEGCPRTADMTSWGGYTPIPGGEV